jgi:hypothetical protein
MMHLGTLITRTLGCALLAAATLAGPTSQAAASGTIPPPTPLPLLFAAGINGSGQILGSSPVADISIWEGGQLRTLARFHNYGGTPTALNDRGAVVGYSEGPCCHSLELGFYIHHGKLERLGQLPCCGDDTSRALAVNDHRLVVGWSWKVAQGPPGLVHAVAWRDGSVVDLSACCTGANSSAVAVNDAGIVVINADTGVFTWRNGVTQLVGGLDTAAAINAGGSIAGASGGHAAVWRTGHRHDLGVLPGASGSGATAINVYGDVVGTSPSPAATSFFWSRRTGMLPLPDPPGFSCQAIGINARRQIAGNCPDPDAPYLPDHAVLWDASALAP